MKITTFLLRWILSSRYKIELKNPEILKYDGPSLIFPNHVALVDPIIIYSFLHPYVKLNPLASKKYYDKAGFKQIMQIVNTIPIEDLQEWGDKEQIKKSLSDILKWLENKKHILLYPSWQIYRQGFEVIRWKQIAYQVCNLMPENTKVFWVRTKWLWGSIYSMAWDNGKTLFWKLILLGIWFIFANLFFFLPKRKVEIEIEDITNQVNTYKKMSLNEFNGFLENFYNKDLKWWKSGYQDLIGLQDNLSVCHSYESRNLPNTIKNNEDPASSAGWQTIDSETSSELQLISWNPAKILKSWNNPEILQKSWNPVYIPHYFYYNDVKNKKEPEIITWSLKDLENTKKLDLSEIPQDIKKTIFSKIAKQKQIPVDQVDENKNLVLDLYFDSLDMAEIKSFIQAKFPQASNPPITDLKSVWDLLMMAVGKSENEEKLKDCNWGKWKRKWDLVDILN